MSVEHPLLVIANPGAGPDSDGENLRVALDVLRANTDVKLLMVDEHTDLERALGRRGRRRVVVAGGDGTVHQVVRVLRLRGELGDTLLGLVPVGTGNDLARTLGIPLDPARAARCVLHGTERRLDLLVDDAGGVAVNTVHVGLGAAVARTAAAFKQRLGRHAFPLGAVLGGLLHPGWHLRVEADGQVLNDYDRRVLLVGLANGSSLGGGLGTLSAAAEPDDGLADVIVSRATGPLARIGFGLGMREGSHVGREDVQVTRARVVRVYGQEFPYDADGDLLGPVRARTWTVEHSVWRVLVPAEEKPTDQSD
ncbi:diacylglycerol/lipid kinase family protein [Carbonactinospora thermoautotrophica]|uniref:diacylglycerol/lipid kinase family protein n=1 Tax=Carbonactinospora thermoautotrophica TaxID=1469144 RepID=UPI003DA7BF43